MSDLLAGEQAAQNTTATDDRAEPPPPSWLVAYAMGLVASGLHVDGVDELVGTAGNDVSSLTAALHHLQDGSVAGDTQLREDAAQLLEAAADQARLASSGVPERVVLLDP